MSPKDAIELQKVPLQKVPLVESYPPEDTLPEDGLYHCLLQPGEEHNEQHKRTMDRISSKVTYRFTLYNVCSTVGYIMMHMGDNFSTVG